MSKLPPPKPLKLSEIISCLKECQEFIALRGPEDDRLIEEVITDSRHVNARSAFIAYKGVSTDSHRFISDVSAAVVICETLPDSKDTNAVLIRVKNSRRAWAYLASAQFDQPEKELEMIGITGTNGKSSTVWILKELSDHMGIKSLSLGTLGAYIASTFIPTNHTTPDPDKFYQLLRHAINLGVSHCYMEVSSIAIAMEKLAPVKFSAVGFTSFSRDHLDYHPSLEQYFHEKSRLFDELSTDNTLKVISSGIKVPNGQRLNTKGSLRVYEGPNKLRNFESLPTDSAKVSEQSLASSSVIWNSAKCKLTVAGDFIIENATCAKIILEKYTNEPPESWPWNKLSSIPGRLEVISTSPGVVVDYAHTPDALEKALLTLRPLCQGKLWAVFGCGGDRDKGKRPLMGSISQKYSDFQVITSDNPRQEDQKLIAEDITSAMKEPYKVILDREQAIKHAIESCGREDIVLIAGKGHEDYQILGNEKKHFDDREVAKKYL